jgi:hypothetical protein
LFALASFGGGCSSGAYQQIVKNFMKINDICEIQQSLSE